MIGSVEHVAGDSRWWSSTEAEDLARAGAELVRTWLSECERPNLIAAVGNSPLGVYAELADERVHLPEP